MTADFAAFVTLIRVFETNECSGGARINGAFKSHLCLTLGLEQVVTRGVFSALLFAENSCLKSISNKELLYAAQISESDCSAMQSGSVTASSSCRGQTLAAKVLFCDVWLSLDLPPRPTRSSFTSLSDKYKIQQTESMDSALFLFFLFNIKERVFYVIFNIARLF